MTEGNGEVGQNVQKKLLQYAELNLALTMVLQIGIFVISFNGVKFYEPARHETNLLLHFTDLAMQKKTGNNFDYLPVLFLHHELCIVFTFGKYN